MPRDDAQAVFRISSRGIATSAAKLRTARRGYQKKINDALEAAGRRSVHILQLHAPESRRDHAGRLKRGIQITGRNSSVRNPHIRIGSTAVSRDFYAPPGDYPFEYTEVTRHGRKGFAAKRKAVKSEALGKRALTIDGNETGQQLARRSASALKFPGPAGTPIFRRRVGPWRPLGGDWVKKAEPEIRTASSAAMNQAAKTLAREMGGGRTTRQASVVRL